MSCFNDDSSSQTRSFSISRSSRPPCASASFSNCFKRHSLGDSGSLSEPEPDGLQSMPSIFKKSLATESIRSSETGNLVKVLHVLRGLVKRRQPGRETLHPANHTQLTRQVKRVKEGPRALRHAVITVSPILNHCIPKADVDCGPSGLTREPEARRPFPGALFILELIERQRKQASHVHTMSAQVKIGRVVHRRVQKEVLGLISGRTVGSTSISINDA
ncbi:leucine-rich repeat flightless-interacting protein 2 [Striga asiatica]|uniref:Leucine-rich repeat flightless-interacting protein 2 n=1 Tax=Striga asiatica TaxID=4170 RepID=A0A5A7PT57_STRAF|nr:leucine-rich repeat flightless-interacting protein 2 [Striga asiatica]